jgi:hypothetical protein
VDRSLDFPNSDLGSNIQLHFYVCTGCIEEVLSGHAGGTFGGFALPVAAAATIQTKGIPVFIPTTLEPSGSTGSSSSSSSQ